VAAATETHGRARPRDEDRARELKPGERRILWLLGLPTFGLALAITVVSTYLPVLARTFSSSTTIIGVIIGGEGLMALWIPLVAGAWSDRLERRYRRLPFVLAGTPAAAVALAFMGFAPSLLVVGLLVALFFAAYFVAYEPYRALYPDLLGDEVAGRSQGSQAVWRGAGTVLAMVGGGLLFTAGKPLPFLVGGVLLAATIAAFALGVVRSDVDPPQRQPHDDADGPVRATVRSVGELLREHRPLRLFLVANALWELSLGALKTFVVLYITRGLGHSLSFASAVIGGSALFIVLGAILSGRLADRLGTTRVMEWALWGYGAGLIVPFALSGVPLVVAVCAPVLAFGGAVLMTLPFALLMPLMPTDDHGSVTGYYSVSRGLGVMLGPLVAGVAISAFAPIMKSTQGYPAMWLVCSASVLLSIPVLRSLRRAAADDPDVDLRRS
jgi:MFS family permease